MLFFCCFLSGKACSEITAAGNDMRVVTKICGVLSSVELVWTLWSRSARILCYCGEKFEKLCENAVAVGRMPTTVNCLQLASFAVFYS